MPFLRSLSNLLCSASYSLINKVAVSLDYSSLLSLSQLKILVVSYSVRRDIQEKGFAESEDDDGKGMSCYRFLEESLLDSLGLIKSKITGRE